MTMLAVLYENIYFVGSAVLFVIGLLMLLLHKNLIKKIIGHLS